MLEELSDGWAHDSLDAELVTRIRKKLGKTHVEVQQGFDYRRKRLRSRKRRYAVIPIE